MKLTWRDAATVPFMAAIIAIYTAHLNGADGWLLASTRGNATAILVLGTVGGCGLGSAQDLYEREGGHGQGPNSRLLYSVVATLLGVTALAAAIAALASASGAALAVLFAATMALWVFSTLRHLFSAAPAAGSALGPRTHEVIDQPPVRH